MPPSYNHLTILDRIEISLRRAQGESLREIAQDIGRSPSTISRELRRNAAWETEGRTAPYSAQTEATARWKGSHRRRRLKNSRLRAYVRGRLEARWSPEQISGRMCRLGYSETISPESIYQWVYHDAPELIEKLPRGKRRRRRSSSPRKPRFCIPGRVSLEERPTEVESRKQAGHWEVDTAVSPRGRGALLVMTERKTRLTLLEHLDRLSAKGVRAALVKRLGQLPTSLRRTLTFDNGKENAGHLKVNEALGTRSFFCAPYRSWEKPVVENTIGVIRRDFPKGTEFNQVTEKEIARVEDALNTRPRKCLGYLTPAEALRLECCTCS